MGQRHQLFVIAQVGQFYRSLAAVDHQWLYGMSALRRCLQILKIFSCNANFLAIQQELRFAEEYFRNKDAPSSTQPELCWDARGGVCPFPFITTCLMMGASLNIETACVAVIEEEPFGMGFDQGDNDDGTTIIDITDLANVKYCFVNFIPNQTILPIYEANTESETSSPLYQPLTGWQYLAGYYPKDHPIVQHNLNIPKSLEEKPLICIRSLAETWPWGGWEVPDPTPPDTHDPTPYRAPMGLMEKCMEKIVDTILVSDEMSDFTSAKDQLETLTNFKTTLRETLLARAHEVGKTLPSLYLLAFVYSGEYTLDWAPFIRINIAGLKSALEAGSFSSVTTINLSGTLASQSPSELLDTLSNLPVLKTLILLERADRPDDSVANQLILSFASSSPSINLSRILLSSTMSLPIRQDLWLPDQAEPPQTIPGFPVTQLLVYHKADGSRNQEAAYEYFFLGDALVGPGRFVNSFLRYLHLLNAKRFRIDNGTGYPLAAYIATASSTLGSQEVGEIGPLPGQVYKVGKNSFHFNLCDSYYSDMRDLKPGQFTILVTRVESEQGIYDNSQHDKGFRYAFVRSKSEISVRPEGDELTKIDHETLEVLSLQEFIQETLPGTSPADLEPLFSQLRSQVAKPDNQSPSNDDVLRCINTEEARDLLEKFIQNIPKLDKVEGNRYNSEET